MSPSLVVLLLFASLILLTNCLDVVAVVLIVVKLVVWSWEFVLLKSHYVASMVTPRPATPLDESELERARLSA